jgi:hypothetical protein
VIDGRRAFLGLTAVGIVGTAIELVTIRHWHGMMQLIPWATLALLTVGLVLLSRTPSPTTARIVGVIALVSAAAGLFGVFEHIWQNYGAAPLDFRYATRWTSMSETSRWWAAANGSVGPSPVLAPAILTQTAVLLGLTSRVARRVADVPARPVESP